MAFLACFTTLFFVAVVQGANQCWPGVMDLAITMSRINNANDAKLAMEAVDLFTQKLDIGTTLQKSRVGFVLFDDQADVQFSLAEWTTNAQVSGGIRSLTYSGNGQINLVNGMDVTIRQIYNRTMKREVPRMALLITDQTDNTKVASEHSLAMENNIDFFAIGVGSGVNLNTLAVATGDARRVFQAASYADLGATIEQICNQFFPTIVPPTVSPAVHSPRSCECDYKKTWLDIIFLIDSSMAVSTQDFNGVRNFLSSFSRTIPISQDIGAYSRVGIINVGSQAHVVADLKKFPDSLSAAKEFRAMAHLKDKTVNMFDGLVEAQNMIDADERLNVQNVVVIFTSNKISCAHYHKSKLQVKGIRTKLEEKDPCRIAAHLRESGNIVITVGMKFDGIGQYPDIDITSPCYSINYDTSMATKITQLMCKANCFCLKPYIQFKDDSKCEEYGECIYLQGIPLDFVGAQTTCDSYSTKLSDVHSAEKERFLQDEHASMGYFPYWVGASKQNGVYEWETGTKLSSTDYTNWAPNQPDASAGECIIENNDKFNKAWYSADCYDFLSQKFFSCQKNACDSNNYCEFDKPQQ